MQSKYALTIIIAMGNFSGLGFFKAENGMGGNSSNNYNSPNDCFGAGLFLYDQPNPQGS